jgi:hypothetical protein
MSDGDADDLAARDPVAPTAAEQLAVALEWLDHPRGFKLDALEAAIKAVARLRAEDAETVARTIEGLKGSIEELRDAVRELDGRVGPEGDNR